MRGIFYAMEEITGSPKIPTVKELSYIQLQQELKAIDEEEIKNAKNNILES